MNTAFNNLNLSLNLRRAFPHIRPFLWVHSFGAILAILIPV